MTLPPVDEVAVHVAAVLAQPIQANELGMTVHIARSVIEVPTEGVVLLALTLHDTALPGSEGLAAVPLPGEGAACQSSASAVGSLEPLVPVATTPYVWIPAFLEL